MKEIRDRYEIFLKVCETGSFSKAAEALNYTQSGISQMMAGFEEELGVQLFARAKKGVTLTDNGRMLMPYIQELTTRQKHLRECYVVAEEGADKAAIEEAIKTMPNYFDEYDTTVTFITEEELKENHSKMPHGGFVIRTGETGCEGNKHVIEYSLKLDSNPEFTGSVLVAYARAAHRLSKKGESGARSVFDIAPAMLSQMTPEELRAHML